VSPATRALVVIDPNNPTGAVYPDDTRRALLKIASDNNVPLLADEVYGELGYDGPLAPLASLDPDAPVISFSSLSKAWLAPGWRAGWLAVGASHRMDDVLAAIRKLADGRLCSPGPMQHAITAAIEGDRSHIATFVGALRERAQLSVDRLNAIEGISCVAPSSAFYAMPKVELPAGVTDEDYVVALLRETGVLCVYGSGFGLPAGDGFMRVVFLASPEELHDIYDLIADFTPRFLAGGAGR
jgi:aspartate/methionine/tyrosine aminotransferase